MTIIARASGQEWGGNSGSYNDTNSHENVSALRRERGEGRRRGNIKTTNVQHCHHGRSNTRWERSNSSEPHDITRASDTRGRNPLVFQRPKQNAWRILCWDGTA